MISRQIPSPSSESFERIYAQCERLGFDLSKVHVGVLRMFFFGGAANYEQIGWSASERHAFRENLSKFERPPKADRPIESEQRRIDRKATSLTFLTPDALQDRR